MSCSGGQSAVIFTATAGTTYRIAVDGKLAEEDSFDLTLENRPPNDDFADAQALTLNGSGYTSVAGETHFASKQAGEPNHAGEPGGVSVWYSFKPTESGDYRLNTCRFTSMDTLLAVYTGSSVNSLSEVTSNDDGTVESASCSGGQSAVIFTATAGTTYRIAVDGKLAEEDSFDLTLENRPPNDDFADAQALTLNGSGYTSVAGETHFASKQAGEPNHAGEPGGVSVWYSFKPTESGDYRLNTCRFTSMDTLLAVYTGSSVNSLSEVASNDDGTVESESCSGGQSAVIFTATAGTTYRIAVDGKLAEEDSFDLTADTLSVIDTTPPDTSIDSGPSGTTTATTASFTYSGTPTSDTDHFQCKLDSGSYSSCPASGKGYAGLAVGSHTFAVRAVDAAGNADASPASRTWTVAAETNDGPEPTSGETVAVEPAEGKVKSKCQGDKRFTKLKQAEEVPVGCLIDTRKGEVELTSARPDGGVQSAHFYEGVFRVQQKPGAKVTDLKLSGKLACQGSKKGGHKGKKKGKGGKKGKHRHKGGGRKRRSAASGSGHHRKSRSKHRGHRKGRGKHGRGHGKHGKHGKGRGLWGKGKGDFRTKGKRGSATVRGTTWFVQDRCDGSTLFKVKEGVVEVRDDVKKKTVTLEAGDRYVAKRRRR